MNVTPSLVERWTEESNTIIKKWKDNEKSRKRIQDLRIHCSAECLKLLQKIQGVAAVRQRVELELAVSYNTLSFTLRDAKPHEIKDQLTCSLIRALEAVGSREQRSDLVTLWQVVLETFNGTVHQAWIHKLLLIQWAVWLSECQFERILRLLQQINPKITPSGDLLAETRNLSFSVKDDASLMVVMAAEDLKDLLRICTFVSKGVEQMKNRNTSEALQDFQDAVTMSSPRALLAHVHTLMGLCYVQLGQPQSALQCYRTAVEMDFSCQRALYQSALVYKQLGNGHAEIEALRVLHSALLLHPENDSLSEPMLLISPDMLLGSEQMAFISQIPSPDHILHMLAHTCVLNDRNSEGAEYYLDLLASLHSPSTPRISTEHGLPFPRIPVVYLEAAFAMLKAKRFWDALAICDEVIAKTADLIPKRLLLEPPVVTHQVTGPVDVPARGLEPDPVEEKLDCVLWSGSAYFLQGRAYLQLKDTKEALTNFTRAINQLVKVCLKQKEWTERGEGEAGTFRDKVVILESLKGQALAGRGLCFVERNQLTWALRDFELSHQTVPGCSNTKLWLVEILWRLDRKEEATVMWKHAQISTPSPTSVHLPLYLQAWQDDAKYHGHSNLHKKMEEFIQSCGTTT
ncbi:Fanconi anemia group G protein [Brachyhypopomus gauderio]|uniref:Fanconi anemia group G protein n=1 Tax=Brachyhypopomus gauderio TaxID=698409 RepID=UPI0040433BB3